MQRLPEPQVVANQVAHHGNELLVDQVGFAPRVGHGSGCLAVLLALLAASGLQADRVNEPRAAGHGLQVEGGVRAEPTHLAGTGCWGVQRGDGFLVGLGGELPAALHGRGRQVEQALNVLRERLEREVTLGWAPLVLKAAR